jgi:phage protein D
MSAEIIRPLPGAYAYAPEISVEVNGRELADPVLRDITELRVTLQLDEPAGFSVTLSNLDPGKQGLGRASQVTPFKYTDRDLLDVNRPITISMGYAGRLRPMLVGEVLSFSPTFPESGLSTLTLTGNDFFHRLRDSRPNSDQERNYKQVRDWEIAQRIAQRHDLDPMVDKDGPEHPIVHQGDDDDLRFLLKRAKVANVVCYISLEKGSKKPKLYFTKPKDLRDSSPVQVFEYRWGESLISFTPKLSIRGLVKKVTVRSWNPRKKDFIEYTAELKDLPKMGGNGRFGMEILEDKNAKEERITTRAVLTAEEARRRAVSILEENASRFISGTGEVMGDPDLRPGVVLRLAGLGRRFSGSYKLLKTEHVFSGSGYRTTFEVERNQEEERPDRS